MTHSGIKVSPKEMRWGVDEEPEIYIPKDLPRKRGLQDVIEYIHTNYRDIHNQRVWRLAFEAIPRRYFYTPHNNKICWREKACYDSLQVWLERGKHEPEKVSLGQRLKALIGF